MNSGRRIEAVCWDLDGTKLNSIPNMKKVSRELAAKHGFEITDEEFEDIIGMGVKRGIEHVLEDKGIKIGKFSYYRSLLYAWERRFDNVDLFPGVHGVLRNLQEAGIKQALTSNSPWFYVQEALLKFNTNGYLDAVVTSSGVRLRKPAPDMINKAVVEKMNIISPTHAVVVGDSPVDIQAANAANAYSVAVLHHLTEAHFVEENAKPTAYVNRIAEITPAFLDDMVRRA